MYSNFVRRHQTIETTPAHKLGVADRGWTLTDVADLVERYEVALAA